MKLIGLISLIGLTGLIGVAFAETANEEALMAELQCGKSKQECLTFCHRPENQDRCLLAAQRQGVMSDEEVRIAKVMQNRVGPGGCHGEECRTYCESNDQKRVIECMRFAVSNPDILATMSPEEQEEMPKVLKALEAGAQMPGGCQGRECKDLCMNPPNEGVARQCIAFGRTAGLMEDVPPGMTDEVMIQIMMGGMKDEGGSVICRGQDCEDVCEESPERCMAGMERLGIDPLTMIPPEAKEEMMEGMAMMRQGLAFAPASAKECINEKLAAYGGLAALEGSDEQVMRAMMKVGRQMEGIMRGCMQSAFMGGGFGPPGGMDMMRFMDGGEDEEYEDEDYADEEDAGFGPAGFSPEMRDAFPGGPPSPQTINACIQEMTENFGRAVSPECQNMSQFAPTSGFPGGPPGGGFLGGGFPGGFSDDEDFEDEEPISSTPLRSFLANTLEVFFGLWLK